MRLARIWENKDQAQNVYELGLLFLDQQCYMVEGCLPANRMNQFKEKLREGLVYKIESFMITTACSKYKTLYHPNRIRITQQTRIAEVEPVPEDFPLYAHNAKPFDVLASRIGDNTVLSDVIGVVTKLTNILPSKSKSGSKEANL